MIGEVIIQLIGVTSQTEWYKQQSKKLKKVTKEMIYADPTRKRNYILQQVKSIDIFLSILNALNLINGKYKVEKKPLNDYREKLCEEYNKTKSIPQFEIGGFTK